MKSNFNYFDHSYNYDATSENFILSVRWLLVVHFWRTLEAQGIGVQPQWTLNHHGRYVNLFLQARSMIMVNGENLEKENQSDSLLLGLHDNFQWRKLGKRINPSASSSCSSISSTLTCVHVVTFMIWFSLSCSFKLSTSVSRVQWSNMFLCSILKNLWVFTVQIHDLLSQVLILKNPWISGWIIEVHDSFSRFSSSPFVDVRDLRIET